MSPIPEFHSDTYPVPVREARSAQDDAVNFILSLARALHTYGYSAEELEGALGLAARRLGIIGQFFSTPTSISVAFGQQHEQRTYLIRVEPGGTNLGKLALLDDVAKRVLHGEITPAHGARRVAEIVAAPPPYGPWLTVAAYALASAAGGRFLGGGLREVVAAGVIGLVVGLLALLAGRVSAVARIFEPVGAFAASALAIALGVWMGPLSTYIATLAGIIILLPGFTVTTAIRELATRHLSSGVARLSSGFMILLTLAFGVALGSRIAVAVFGTPAVASPVPLPGWTLVLSLGAVSLAFVVLLRAQVDDTPWILASGVVGFLGARLGGIILGLELGAFVGALAVGIAANVYGRLRDRPPEISIVPGVLLLVPGSIGYRSLSALMNREVVSGVETAFTMILIAVALVTGLQLAAMMPQRRAR